MLLLFVKVAAHAGSQECWAFTALLFELLLIFSCVSRSGLSCRKLSDLNEAFRDLIWVIFMASMSKPNDVHGTVRFRNRASVPKT